MTTCAWRDFVADLVNDPELQQALADAIKAHPELLFKAAEDACRCVLAPA